MRHARTLQLLVLAAALATTDSVPSAAAQPAGADHLERMTATVRAVDLEHRSLDLVTGVGYALRIRRVEAPAGLTVDDRGARLPLAAVTAGCIVRVECHRSAAGMVASTLELLERPAQAPKP